MHDKERYQKLWDKVINGSPALRVAICEREPMLFAAYYFTQYFKFEVPDFHYDLYEDCKGLTDGTINEAAWIVHRYGAKTALAKIALAIWAICYKKKRYINWDSEDKSNAESALFDITLALQTNKKIISDFGHLYHKKPQKEALSEAKLKRINNFITENGVKVEAFSTHVSTRGRLYGEIRPDLFILDDIENNITKDSFQKTHSVISHYDEMKSGLTAGASVLVLGNYITDTGSVAHIMEGVKRNKDKARLRFIPVVDKKGIISWPAQFVKTDKEAVELNRSISDPTLHKTSLEAKRRELGDAVFETEMMLNPSKSGDLYFDREKVDEALKHVKEPIEVNADMKVWGKHSPRCRYGMGADTAEGIGADSNASAIIQGSMKNTPAILVASFEDNQMSNTIFGWELKRQGAVYGFPYLVNELNQTGYGTQAELINAEYPTDKMYRREVKNKTTNRVQQEFGWKATTGTKSEVMGEFKRAWEEGEILIYDEALLNEMRLYTKAAARLANRVKGESRHYDKLRAAALAWYALSFAPAVAADYKKKFEVPGQNEPYKM